jgi:hypothetical protein
VMRMPSLQPELVAALKRLKLGHMADTLPERIVLAKKHDMSLEDLMLLVFSAPSARVAGFHARAESD